MEGFAKAANMKLVFVANSPDFNGAYDISGDTMYLDIYAGVDPMDKLSDLIIPTASHELTHWMHYQAPVAWSKLSGAVFKALEEVDGISREQRIKNEIERLKGKGLVHNKLVAEDEIVARACEDMLAKSEVGKKVFNSLSESEQKTITGKIKSIIQALKDWISDFLSSYKPSNRIEAEKIRQAQDKVNEILKLWNEGIAKSVEVSKAETKAEAFIGNDVYEQYGVEFDVERLSSSELGGMLYSLKYNDDIAEGQNKYLENKSAHVSKSELKKAQEVTRAMVDVMMKYSHILPEDKIGKVLTKNGSYDRSVENTTICVRTLAYNDFVDKVQEELGRPLSQMESFLVSQKMYDIATDPQCLYCYVSLDRKAFNDMLLRYIQDRDTVIAKYNNSDKSPKAIDGLYEEFLNKRKDTKEMKSRFNKWIDYADNGTQLLSLADISTEANQSDIKAKGGILAEQLTDARKYAQSASWAKIQKNYVAYRDEILRMGDRVVKNLNEHYGLRWYSFSDYSAAFIVENMQQITDASIRGLKGLAYTKDTDFVEIFAPSGMNINVSVFVNQDADGKFNIDERQSASLEKAIELRNKYPNVGIVATVTNDEALKWAAEQEWSDVIIPFHIVRTGTDVAEYYKWLNYTSESGDTIKDRNLWDAYVDSLNLKSENARKKVSKNIYPSEHNNDKATYLNLCESRGLTPRFVRFAGESWYMKLVNETRLSADESSTLKPNYNLNAAKESFQKFVDKGGYEGGWYKDDVDVDAEAKAVADDVRAGKKANEVDYGRQDGFVPEDVMSSRKANRTHGANKPGMLLSEKDTTTSDKKTFSYDELVAKGDLLGVVIKKDQQIRTTSDGSIDADFVVSEVKKKCESIKTKASTPTYYTNVSDIDRNVEITKNGVIHSFFSSVGSNKKASQRDLINARVSLEIPQILKNSIEVNRSKRGNNLDVPYSHVMMGTVAIEDESGNLEYYAVRSVIEERANQNPILAEAKILGKLYAVNAKKIGTPNAQVVKNDVALTYDAAYTYNIAQFLNDVKTEFNDTFSEDVYKNMGAQRQNNVFSKNLLFSEKDTTDAEYMSVVKNGDMKTAQKMVDEEAKRKGYTVKAYHGTARADRVGTVFRPDRATSGPMAYFTDSKEIASNYARDKADTSLAYDGEYDSYYTQFRVNRDGKSISIPELWKYLSISEKNKIKELAGSIKFDDEYENIIVDKSSKHGNGAYDDYTLNMHRGNVLEALVDTWLETGDLYRREADFLEVLELVGIKDAEYRDPDARQE
ncbi:MAG: hypothetical protein U0L72_10380, partial [Acutalibacteraceae bacterium]|nr:hypothetical protein [Acutalibacteraceae bacterium]